MKLLVVGASGFIGRNVVEGAARRGWTVTGTYRLSKDFPSFADRVGCEAVPYDGLREIADWDADACVYAAGNANHVASVRDPLGDLQANAESLVRFLGGYRGGLVFLSSAAVYDGHHGPVGPQTRLRPRLPYAVSKLACEGYVSHFADRGDLAWSTVLRLYYAYGPHDRTSRLVPRLVEGAESGDREFRITAPRGSLVDPLYVGDVVGAVLCAAQGRAPGKTLDLCAGRPRSVTAFVRDAAEVQGWRPRIVTAQREDETPVRFHSDPRPARRALGLDAPVPLAQGIRRYRRWRLGGRD